MNALANIWNHPRTSLTGLLIGVASIGSVLAQQGVTLGKAGTGTVVSLATGLATVLLGLLAKDPSTQPTSAKTTDQQVGMTAG
jgi:drug/metabolite transporter (DMT)-like permease